ncbi:hypothetical protein CC85DRAFT_41893 [Cutaneotrichosporon oleaginosum]|uniref:Uncharacterized protein n=1 Tax=Cutaneotrichosporon oleaginosum TaxID=879819 RepID=A0A0J0XRF9_9TREE|nr:uncharacterized protein CC85DRAFT_41893 [Cutaneotrichosporon oleaginosum]KLT43680.1 hypothetical protein CC85DRAFT_41893 [Cutaneotrichosporon oleaginosum]TXT05099.1 hypothetical protein COLE_06419 [Cutaneotrichosporon oleaginosum]
MDQAPRIPGARARRISCLDRPGIDPETPLDVDTVMMPTNEATIMHRRRVGGEWRPDHHWCWSAEQTETERLARPNRRFPTGHRREAPRSRDNAMNSSGLTVTWSVERADGHGQMRRARRPDFQGFFRSGDYAVSKPSTYVCVLRLSLALSESIPASSPHTYCPSFAQRGVRRRIVMTELRRWRHVWWAAIPAKPVEYGW